LLGGGGKVISFLLLSLAFAQPQSALPPGCELDAPVRDPAVCEPLYDDDGNYVIWNVESVAVGTIKEMKRVREMTKHCNVDNRIDYLGGVDLAVFDIVNADHVSRVCVTGWISENRSDLEYSEPRFEQKFKDAPLIEESDLP
jgi:hypothetical protein